MDFEQSKASRTYLQDYVTRISRHYYNLLDNNENTMNRLKRPYLVNPTSSNNELLTATMDKARYYPTETACVMFTMTNNQSIASNTTVTFNIYHKADQLTSFDVSTKVAPNTTKDFTAFWPTPDQDYQGYRIEIVIRGQVVKVLAVDVSSNIDKFPRYGTVTTFTPGTDNSDKLSLMKDLSINSIQYYDAYWTPQEPIPMDNPTGNYTQNWAVWLSDTDKVKSGQVVKNTVDYAHRLNMDSLFYNMIYAFTGDANNKDYLASIGVDPTWILHNQNGNLFQDNMDPGATGQTALDATQTYLDITNPAVADWIAKRMNIVLQNLNFDGWHGDTIGNNDPMNVLDSNGKVTETYSVKDKLGAYANLIKDRLEGRKFVINTVAGGGEQDLAKSEADFPYSETWSGTYYDVDQRIKYITYESGKSMVIPGYLQEGYAKNHHGGTFNPNAVLLFDAIVYAAGGSRLEIVNGDSLLVAEFFPNTDLSVPANLKVQMLNYQTFITAYENLLRDGQLDNNKTINLIDMQGNLINSSNNAAANTIYAYSRDSKENETIQLINLLGVSDNHWQDDTGTREDPTTIQDFRVKIYTNETPDNVYLVTPDEYHTNQTVPLTFYAKIDGNGSYLDIQVPYLHRWDMLYFKRNQSSLTTDYSQALANEAQKDMDAANESNQMANFDSKWAYSGADLGATYNEEGTTLKVWAPTAKTVQVVTYDINNNNTGFYPMERGTVQDSDNHINNNIGVFTAQLIGNQKGTIYTYLVTHNDGTTSETQDPYSVAVTDHGNKSVIVNLNDTNPANWKTTNNNRVPNPTQAIVAETHVRDFSNSSTSGIQDNLKGTLLGMAQGGTKDPNNGLSTGFDYVKQSNINYIELQPIADDNNSEDDINAYTWGYDTKNFNVVNSAYSTNKNNPLSGIVDLKAMIAAYHNAGINVAMDVVYNHVGGDANQSSFNKLVPNYYFRKDANGNLTNASNCGNDFAAEHEMGRKFIVDSTDYWANEFGIDGFRFDLMTSLSVPTMQAIQKNQADKNMLLFGEGWEMNTTLNSNDTATLNNANQLASTGFFNGSFRKVVAGENNGSYNGWVSGNWTQNTIDIITASIKGGENLEGSTFINPGQNVNYIENHDDQTLSDKLWAENPKDDSGLHGLRMSLANAMNGLNQGITYTQIGQSFWRNKDGNSNSYNAGDNINNVNWDYLKYHQDTDSQMTQIFSLKKQYPEAFAITNYQDINNRITIDNASGGVISYTIKSPQGKFIILFNSTMSDIHIGTGSTDNLKYNYNDVMFSYGVNKASNNTIQLNNNQLTIPLLSYVVYRFDA